jgi:MHS family proline/betaine transporter-like MFS transporter
MIKEDQNSFVKKLYLSKLSKESIIAILGITSEYYNIFLYGYMAYIIIPNFFSFSSPLIILSAIFLSYIIGPIGAIVCGHVGDTLGRKKILAWTVAGIALSSFFISILPTYDQIGIIASILFIALRSVQTLAFGGDMVGLVTFILEDTPKNKRGLFGGYMSMGAGLGVGLASFFLFLLKPFNDSGLLWKWRILLSLGLFGMIIAIYFAKSLGETATFRRYKESRYISTWPFFDLLKDNKMLLLKIIGITALVPIITIVIYGYIPFLSVTHLHLSFKISMRDNFIALLIFALGAPFFGYLSDKRGRKFVLFGVSLIFFFLGFPLFWFLNYVNKFIFFIVQLLFSLIASAYYGVTMTASVETFPTHIRYTGIALGYYISYALFGGINGAFVEKFLIKHVFLEISPVFYLLFGSFIVFISVCFLKEKACHKLSNNSL